MSSAEEDPPVTPKRKRRLLRWISLAVVVLVIGGLITSYFKFKTINDAIHREAVTGLGPRPHVYSTGSMNILVFGSDSRSGLDHHERVVLHTGDASNSSGLGNTDTILLVHIAPGRGQVTAMSIPRDTMVPLYGCASGPGYPGQAENLASTERVNSLFSVGGPACLWKTVEQQTGIHIDHFLEIGLAGFANVINDLGGVTVCAPFRVSDPVSGLVLKPGEQHIDGDVALSFWRTREALGLGSDLQRIQRDQFMSAQVVKGLLGSGLLSDPGRLLTVANGLAPNLTTDNDMSLTDLVSLGLSLHGLSGSDVRFVTAPTAPDPVDPAAVTFAQPQADELFSAIARDASGAGGSRPGVSPASPASPVSAKVRVLNGNGTPGIAAVTAGELSSRGFTVTGTGDAPSGTGATAGTGASSGYPPAVIEYGSPAELPAARTLLAQVPGATLRPTPSVGTGTLVLILGPGFTDLAPQSSPAAPATGPATGRPAAPSPSTGKSPSFSQSAVSARIIESASPSPSSSPSPSPSSGQASGVSSATTANGGISAAASCGSDTGAFQGPLSP